MNNFQSVKRECPKADRMRMSKDEKERSHQRIVASAARLFRERGLEGASVGDVMAAAGMTHGGFYKHFDSKDALAGSALALAFAEFTQPLEGNDDRDGYALYRARYLTPGSAVRSPRWARTSGVQLLG